MQGILWVENCINKVIVFGRKVVQVGVCLFLDGNHPDGFVRHVWVVFLEPFDNATEMRAMVLTASDIS